LATAGIVALQRSLGNQRVGYLVQRRLVQLPSPPPPSVALDEEPESVVNDGELRYVVRRTTGPLYYLEDPWGEIVVYDTAASQKVGVFALAKKLHSRAVLDRNWRPDPLERAALERATEADPAEARRAQGYLHDVAPDLVPHSGKRFATGTLPLAQNNISGGVAGDYRFVAAPERLTIRYRSTELGFMTITTPRAALEPIKVGELKVHDAYQGMNLSRVLMVMLAQAVVARGGPVQIYSVGQDTAITNRGFWNQYGTDARKLLLRGDHQRIDVPTTPLAGSATG
jgi:hypothetical protein